MSEKRETSGAPMPGGRGGGLRGGGLRGGGGGRGRVVEKPKDFSGTLKKLIKYMRRSLPAVVAAMLLAVGSVVLTIFIPRLSGDAVQLLYEGLMRGAVDIDAVLSVLRLMCVLVFLSAGVSYVQSFILAGVAQRVAYRMRKEIYDKIDRLPLKYYDTTTNGSVLSYLTNDVDTVATTLNQSLSQLLSAVTKLVGVFVMMILISRIITLAALVIIPLSFILMTLIVKRSQKYFVRQQKALADVNAHIEEMYAGAKVVELYNGQAESLEKFEGYNDQLCAAGRQSQFLSGLMHPVMSFVGNLSYVMVCVLGGVLIVNNVGGLNVGSIQSLMTYVRQFNQPMAQLAGITNTLQSTVAAGERVLSFLEAEDEAETGTASPKNVAGGITFENVRFGYDPEIPVIRRFSSEIRAGQRVAIVGPTGAGKTTVVKLLMRYYDIQGGRILLDGRDISEFKRAELRKNFGMVLQDTWLFNGTVMDNLRYGNLDASDGAVIEAAKKAGVDRFIRTLEGGYQFVINEEADNISAGQKQLLTIARAMLNDPKILILDEATSSVDTRTEVIVQEVMHEMMRGRTSFVIAHRLSTIRDADKILVMKDGDIIEQGTHEALLAQKGFYENLYNSQFER
ncbi:MAG: ABC transporter ATP-binding protein/permease [Clostridiales bacterium]|jgi:ATP-binding cassette subfamily B protein|nr:ABC transporter ATP-binding protein/permease [Clostridiales bacterium]